MDMTKSGYRLPTEAEWEYAARAGTTTAYNVGDSLTDADANFDSSVMVEVGSYAANDWGLYDMHGNVHEWVWDWYDDYSSTLSDPAEVDPDGPDSGAAHVRRGGSWDSSAWILRSAFRDDYMPSDTSALIGFRVVRF